MQQTNQITKLTIAEPEQFVRFFKFYRKCNDTAEITLNFDKDRLHFREMNQANTLMTDITIKDSLFVEFYAEKDKKDIYIPDFLSFLKRANKEDLMQLEFNDLKYDVILKSNITRTFTGNIMNFEKTEQKLPELKFDVKLSIDANTLYNFLKDFKKESYRIEIAARKDNLKLRVFDYDLKQIGTITLEANGIAEKPAKSVYSFQDFKNSITNKLTEKVFLSLNNEYPLRIEYSQDNYNASVIITPIIDAGLPEDTKPEIKVIMDELEKEIEINKTLNQKKGKLDLDALGFNENFKCPNCKDMISFYFFVDKFSTQIGAVKDAIEQYYNADKDFAEFVFESSFNEDLSEDIKKLVKARLKEMFKRFKRGG